MDEFNKMLEDFAATPMGQSTKRMNDVLFQLSTERAELRKLVADLYDGLDDYWQERPQNAEIVKAAKAIHDKETKDGH